MKADECRALQQRLADDLVGLRAQFQEAVANYSVRVQGMLAEAGDAFATDDPSRLGKDDLDARASALRELRRELADLQLKPAKGRGKDLRAIRRVAEHACDMVADW